MKDAKLRIHSGKIIFYVQRIHFLKYIIMDKRMKIGPDKVKAIREWPTLTLVKKILLFLGFAGFYQKFMKTYSEIIAPLTEMTRKDIVFTWGSKEQKAFDMLKKQFMTELILIMFDPTKSIMLEMDASNLVLEAVITQQKLDGK